MGAFNVATDLRQLFQDRFLVLASLGSGSHSMVFFALDITLKELVALKVSDFRKNLFKDFNESDQLNLEVVMAKREQEMLKAKIEGVVSLHSDTHGFSMVNDYASVIAMNYLGKMINTSYLHILNFYSTEEGRGLLDVLVIMPRKVVEYYTL